MEVAKEVFKMETKLTKVDTKITSVCFKPFNLTLLPAYLQKHQQKKNC